MRAIDKTIALDSLAADAFFAKARMLESLGRFSEARRAYLAAKDRDQLRFRASEEMNVILREEATVVETQATLAAALEDGIIGSDLMLEHLHPNVEG